jgi:DNA-binding response OmpR family regulator
MVVTILLADNNPDDVLLLEYAFRQAGLEAQIRVVQDGRSAIDYLNGEGNYQDRNRHPFPSLLLMDLRLPRIDGLEVLGWVRAQRKLDGLTVVMFSGPSSEHEFEHAYRLGANSCLVKPLSFRDLVDLVKAHLGGLLHEWQAAA